MDDIRNNNGTISNPADGWPPNRSVTPHLPYAELYGDPWQTWIPRPEYDDANARFGQYPGTDRHGIEVPYSERGNYPHFFEGWEPYPYE